MIRGDAPGLALFTGNKVLASVDAAIIQCGMIC
jgi:hypothetical protein